MGRGLLSAVFGVPRFLYAAVWYLKDGYIEKALGGNPLFVVLGFMFLPLTTLGYAFGLSNLATTPGAMTTTGWILTAVGFALDVGLVSRTKGRG